MLKQIQTDCRLDRMLQTQPPRLAVWFLRMVLPKTEHVTVIGELEEEFHTSIVPRMGVIRSKVWFWAESLSLIAGYTRVLLIREDSRDLTVVMTARRMRRRWGKQDKGKDRGNRLDSLIQDIRHGYRSLRKRPSFTLAAMLTLAIGIGVNTAIFSLLYAVLIKPLPFQEPDPPVVFNVTAAEESGPGGIRKVMADQLCSPVRWYDSMCKMADDQMEVFAEVGPKKVLTGLLRKIIQGTNSHEAYNVDSMKGLEAFLKAVT